MPSHSESRFLPYRPERLYDLVADVEKYPEFLPWCLTVRVLERSETAMSARMTVGFRVLRESFTSRVTLEPKSLITVEYLEGPFRYLRNCWEFQEEGDGCRLHFDIDFEFRSRVLRMVMEPVFTNAVRRMVIAFETRARVLERRALRSSDPVSQPD